MGQVGNLMLFAVPTCPALSFLCHRSFYPGDVAPTSFHICRSLGLYRCISAWATPASQLRSVQTSSNTVIFYCSLYTRDKRIFNLKCSLSTYVLQTLKLLVWYLKYMSIWSLHQVLHFLSIAHIGLLTLISYWNQWIGRISGNPLNHL